MEIVVGDLRDPASLGDVAQFAVDCVDNPACQNLVIELGQPQTTSILEAVRIFERVTGRSFELQFVPTAAMSAKRTAANDPLQVMLSTMMLYLAHGIQMDTALAKRLFSFPLATVEDYARRVLE